MPRVTIDTKEALSFEPVEPGAYEMTVAKIEGPEQGEKAKYMVVYYDFQDPELKQKAGSVIRNYPIDGKGAGFFRDFWKAATGQDIPVGVELDIDTDDAISRPVIVQIEHEDWEGKTRNKAARVTAAA